MKTRNQTDAWIYYTTIVLGSILMLSIAGMVIFMFMLHTISEMLVALGVVAGAGLAKLFISPLTLGLLE